MVVFVDPYVGDVEPQADQPVQLDFVGIVDRSEVEMQAVLGRLALGDI